MFKLTGYTLGERSNPLAAMVVASNTTTQNSTGSTLDGQTIVDFASIFIAGKVSDNVGGFAQYTHAFLDSQDPANGNWKGHFAADNFDLRYADRKVDPTTDLVWGVTLHNNPTVQDVWNSTPAWGYPYVSTTHGAFGGLPASTLVEGALAQQVAGIGGYVFVNRSIYAELTSYQTAKDGLAFLSYGSQAGDPDHPLSNLDGNSIYWRLAYTHEWDAHNVMLGAFGMDAKVFPNDGTTFQPITNAGSTHYQDAGLDAQYQYLLAPHTFTAHLRAARESINDGSLTAYTDGPATLNTLMAKASYVYREKYGASLAYKSVTGSADSTAYSGSARLVPDTELWSPEVFWMPNQNMRIGIQFNFFTKYLGASSNYDGAGRSASDNNTTYIYFWAAL